MLLEKSLRLVGSVTLCGVCAMSALSTYGQRSRQERPSKQKVEVSGVVEDSDGNRVNGARVIFSVNGISQEVKTGEDGSFRSPVKEGQIIAKVVAPGFCPASRPPVWV